MITPDQQQQLEERGIFVYEPGERDPDGTPRTSAVDPLVVYEALYRAVDVPALLGELDRIGRQLEGDSPDEAKAPAAPAPEIDVAALEARAQEIVDRLTAATRAAFDVRPLDDDGHGLTVAETLTLLYRFLAWMAERSARPAATAAPEPEAA